MFVDFIVILSSSSFYSSCGPAGAVFFPARFKDVLEEPSFYLPNSLLGDVVRGNVDARLVSLRKRLSPKPDLGLALRWFYIIAHMNRCLHLYPPFLFFEIQICIHTLFSPSFDTFSLVSASNVTSSVL